jgi:uncharacterized protein involved in type VI secretion and phage assembly
MTDKTKPQTSYRLHLIKVLKLIKIGRDDPTFMEKSPEEILRQINKVWEDTDEEVIKYLNKHKVV